MVRYRAGKLQPHTEGSPYPQVLLQEESDNYNMYTSGEREELLFRLFKHLALGGPVNQVRSASINHPCNINIFSVHPQYEDTIQPYLDTAKLLYKELLR